MNYLLRLTMPILLAVLATTVRANTYTYEFTKRCLAEMANNLWEESTGHSKQMGAISAMIKRKGNSLERVKSPQRL